MRSAHRKHAGIEVRHAKACRSNTGGRCNCDPSYRAEVFDKSTGRRKRETFPTLAAAKGWRDDAKVALRKGTLTAAVTPTVREAGDTLIAGMRDGSIRTRTGTPYKPSAARSYRRALDKRINPRLGPKRLADVRRADVQALIDKLASDGLDGSTIRNTLDPLRVIFRRAMTRELVAVNPMASLEVPAASGTRERIATPEEAADLIAALPAEERALWATAMYAGLRRGELRGLRWTDVDLAAGVIRVERGWDAEEGEIDGKSKAARRTVPVPAVLRDHLVEHRMSRGGDGLVYGATDTVPFEPSTVRRRALAAWKRAKLEPIALHESRHTFASLAIAAGVNAKCLSSYMGHSSVTITFDRYGHLFPGNEGEAAGLLDDYLMRSSAGHSRGTNASEQPDSAGLSRNGVVDETPAFPSILAL